MDHSVRGSVHPDGIWMLVGKDGKTTPAPFDVTKEVMDLNPYNQASIAALSLSSNPGIAIHPHWLQASNDVKQANNVVVLEDTPTS